MILSGCPTIGTFAQSLLEQRSTVTTSNLDYLADDFLFPVDFLRYWLDCRLSNICLSRYLFATEEIRRGPAYRTVPGFGGNNPATVTTSDIVHGDTTNRTYTLFSYALSRLSTLLLVVVCSLEILRVGGRTPASTLVEYSFSTGTQTRAVRPGFFQLCRSPRGRLLFPTLLLARLSNADKGHQQHNCEQSSIFAYPSYVFRISRSSLTSELRHRR